MSNEELISAPGTLEIGGLTLLVAKPTEHDSATLLLNARKQAPKFYKPVRDTLDTLKELEDAGYKLSDIQKNDAVAKAFAVERSKEVPADIMTSYLTGPRGCAFQLYILTRKTHPELTLEKIQEWITEDNAVVVFAELDEASGVNLIHKALEGSGFFPQP